MKIKIIILIEKNSPTACIGVSLSALKVCKFFVLKIRGSRCFDRLIFGRMPRQLAAG